MKRYHYLIVLLLLFFSCYSFEVLGKVSVARIFQDNMVLQRDKPIIVYGTGQIGEQVRVSLQGVVRNTIIDENKKWEVTFPPFSANSSPSILKVNNLEIRNVLIGDVWVLSGQSNMVLSMERAQELNRPNNSKIRLCRFDFPRLSPKDGYTAEELKRHKGVANFFEYSWEVANHDNILQFSALGYLVGEKLQNNLDIPIGLIQNAVGGSALNNWIHPNDLKNDRIGKLYFEGDWLENELVSNAHKDRCRNAFKNTLSLDCGWRAGEMPYRFVCEPGYIYQASQYHLKNLRVKGMIWYQGETDATNSRVADIYHDLFPLFVRNWNNVFSEVELPIYTVQLPKINRNSWPYFRNIQSEVSSSDDNTYLTVTFDTGDPNDVHPTDKSSIAIRVFKSILNNSYDIPRLLHPEISGTLIEGNKIKISIDNCGNACSSRSNNISGFEWVQNNSTTQLNATLVNNNTIEVYLPSHIQINNGELLYGWQGVPTINTYIYNSGDMPLGPFRIQSW